MATMMQQANTLRRAMEEEKGASMGVWQMLPGSNVSTAIARCGFDWILVDCEHGNIDDAAMHEAVAAIAACGVSPIVRILDNQGWMVKRALDAGAHGILVPLLYTVEDAKKVVTAAKFPPVGNEDLALRDYLKEANDTILTIVQVETKEALDNVDGIAAVAGVDVIFVGPFDLGNSIGHPMVDGKMHDSLHAAIEKIYKAARAAGKKTGIFCTSGEQSKEYADMGFDMISVITDMAALPTIMMDTLNKAKGLGPAAKLTGPYGK